MSANKLSAARARQILSAAQKTRVLVVGDVMLGQFIWGGVSHISPEAPVPAVVDAGLGAQSETASATSPLTAFLN